MSFEVREHAPALYEAEFGTNTVSDRELAVRQIFQRVSVDLLREGTEIPTDFTPGPESLKAIKFAAKTRMIQELGSKIAASIKSDRIQVVDVEATSPKTYRHGEEIIVFPSPEKDLVAATFAGQEEGILQMMSYLKPEIPDATLVGETITRWDRNTARQHFPLRLADYEDGTEIFRLGTKLPSTFLELTYTLGERAPDFSLVFEPLSK